MEEIKQGYKQTDIGVIPEEWNLSPVRNLGVFSKGSGISRAESNTGILPSIRYGEIYTVHNDYIKKFSSFISTEVAKKAKRLKCGDILFTASGETKEEIGKCVAFIHDIEAYAGGDIIILSPRNANSLFLGFLFNAPYVVKQKANKGQGDAIVHITKASIGNITVALPESVNEQTAIATALSDIDAFIAALDKKIAKKQQIKQGTMQQLLAGKKRLPEFSGEWVEKQLGECFIKIIGGGTPSRANADYWNGNIPWATVKDFATFNPITTQEYITHIGLTNSSSHLIPKFTPITSTRMGLGKIVVYHVDVAINQDLKALFIKEDYDQNYIVHWFNFSSEIIEALGTGSTVKGIRLEQLKNIPIYLSNNKDEQTAIAKILTDMDNEITQLEKERDKYVQLKAGMMQVLLTGKIRLVKK